MSQARETQTEPVAATRPPSAARPSHDGPAPGVAALLRLQRGAGNAAVAGLVRGTGQQPSRRPAPRPKPPNAGSTVTSGAAPATPAAVPSVSAPPRQAAEPAPALDEGGSGPAETTPVTPAPGLGDDELATLDQNVDSPPASAPGPVAQTEPDDEAAAPDLGAAQAEVAEGAQAEVDAASADTGPEPEPGGGGGGGGGPIEEPPAPPAPNLAGAPPEQAMAQLGALPPGRMAAAVGGVEDSAGAAVAREQGRLAAAPPQHTPLAATTTLAEPASSLVPASGPASQARVGRVPSRTARPTPPPRPVPSPGPAPTSRVAAPPLPAAPQGGLTQAAAHDLAASITRLPVHDPGTRVTPGPAPRVALTGDADPGQVTAQQAQLTQGTAVAQAEGARDAGEPLGEDAVHPTTAVETMRAEIPAASGGAAPSAASGPAAGETDAADSAVSAVAEEQQGPELRAAAGSAATAMASARAQHAEQEQAQRRQSAEQIAGMEREHAEAESAERTRVRGEVAEQRTQWRTEQRTLVTTAHAEAQTVVGTAGQTVENERQQAETEAAEHHRQGEQEAAAARQEGEREAAQHRAEAQRESGGGGFFGWLASRAQALFDRVKQGITAAFEKARQAVSAAIAKAQQLATAVIERARQAAVAAIRLAGTALTAIGDRVLAGFPALRDRFRTAIQARVRQAESAVNRLAEGLKSGVRAALGLLGRGLSALLSGLERGLKAAVDGVAATVRGAINAARAALQTLGAFMAIARDVAANPGAWLRNLAASVMDGIRNHLWLALKTAVQQWFNDKVEQVLGLGRAVWNLLTRGGISLARIGQMAWQGIKQAIPAALIGILVEKLASMIIPAAGAVLAIIQGLQAAWGTVSRILQAIDRFVAFLRAVKSGNGGQAFAAAVAAAAVTVIDFVSNWLLARLARGASRVANKIRDIARRIGAALKRVVTRIGAALRRVGRRIGERFRGVRDRFRAWRERRRGRSPRPRESPQQKLDRVVGLLRPTLERILAKGTSGILLRTRLLALRLRHGLTALTATKQGHRVEVVAKVNPSAPVTFGLEPEEHRVREIVQQASLTVAAEQGDRAYQMDQARSGDRPGAALEDRAAINITGGRDFLAFALHGGNPSLARPKGTELRYLVGRDGIEVRERKGKGDHLNWFTQGSGSYSIGSEQPFPAIRRGGAGGIPVAAHNLLPRDLSGLGSNDQEAARNLADFVRTGVVPAGLESRREQLASNAMLLFGRESARNVGNAAHAPMMLDIVASGHASFDDMFDDPRRFMALWGRGVPRKGDTLYASAWSRTGGALPMSMGSAQQAARDLRAGRNTREARELARREYQLIMRWLRTVGFVYRPGPEGEAALREFVLNRLRQFYGVAGRTIARA
jgi:hypothetical protein